MKITFDDDGFDSLTIVDNRKPKESDIKHCGECRYFHRHYIRITFLQLMAQHSW